MFSNINWQDLGERAVWTAAQAFLGVFAAVNVTDVVAVKSAAVAGIAAAAAALLSLIKNVVKQQIEAV